MANQTKIILFIVTLVALIAVITLGLKPKEAPSDKPDSSATKNNFTSIISDSAESSNSIASEWRWQELDNKDVRHESEAESDALPFTAQSVYDALQAVEIDQNGDIVLDHNALIALDEALERIHNKLDAESLQSLIELIKEALPGKAGEQTAQLVDDYHSFLGAQAEFNQLHQYSMSDTQTLASIEQDRSLYSELQALRDLHLGDQATDRLFQVSDANAQFMFDSMSLDLNTNLTPEERAQRRKEIEQRYKEQTSP